MICHLLAMLLLGISVPVTHDVPIDDCAEQVTVQVDTLMEDDRYEVNEDPSDQPNCDLAETPEDDVILPEPKPRQDDRRTINPLVRQPKLVSP